MLQVIAILAALVSIPILMKLKLPSGCCMILAATIAGFIGRLPVTTVARDFLHVFTQWSTFSSVLIVIEIAMLGTLMTHYGLFHRAELALKAFLPYPRLIIMLLPAMIGMLQVPGGAALSAPFCNTLGTEMGLSPSQRSNTNVICRHVFMLFAPFSTCIVLAVSMAPGLNVPLFLLTCFSFTAVMVAGNYFFFLRKSIPIELPRVSAVERFKQLGKFFFALSPILVVVILSVFLKLSYVFAVPVAVFAVFLLCDKKDFFRTLAKSYNFGLTVMIVGIYFFQNIVKDMTQLQNLVHGLLSGGSNLVFLLVIAVASLLFGLASGLMYTPLGVLVPIIVSVSAPGMPLLVNMFYVFCWSFLGYVFSPLHMCQILSDRECGCIISQRYRTYIPLILLLIAASIGLFSLYSFLFL